MTGNDATPEKPKTVGIEGLSKEVGWLLMSAGVIGVILPGIPGAPFLIVGLFVVTPGGSKRLARWIGNNPPNFVKNGMNQIARFVDDLERRYPRLPNGGH